MDSPSSQARSTVPARSATQIAAPIVVFAISVACFLPAVRNGFVNWDDNGNFLTNLEYQTFTWKSVKWALTTRLMGHYQPVNWLTFIVDHALAGSIGPAGPGADDDPFLSKLRPKEWPTHPPSAGRFHQTQAILHGIAAALVYFLARCLVRGRDGRPTSAFEPWLCAFAALLFAVHPLRVESVVWASARTDVLAAIFMTSATLTYLRGLRDRPAAAAPRLPTRVMVAGFMVLAVCSKVMAITLPIVLLVLDAYCGRISGPNESESGGGSERLRSIVRLIWQKVELFAIAIAGVLVAKWAHADSIVDLRVHSISNRIAQFFVSLAFYPCKTIVPEKFSPLYEFPGQFGWTHPQVLVSFAAVMIALVLILIFRRNAAIWAAVAAYVVLIAPVTGLTQRGTQMVADRYSYIACIPLAFLAAGLLARLARRNARFAAGVGTVILALLVVQTQRQITYWHDSRSLWERAIELDPTNATAYAAMGAIHDSIGMPEKSLRYYQKAVSIRHQQYGAWHGMGKLHRDAGNDQEAIRCFLTELEFNPTLSTAREQLCRALARTGRLHEAEPHLRILLADPAMADNTLVRHMLADICADHGAFAEAIFLLDEGIKLARRTNQTAALSKMAEAREVYVAAARELAARATQPASRQADGDDAGEKP